MQYQVVARRYMSAGEWEYYPYWAPVREKDAAQRLAGYAAHAGYEAAILQGVTAEQLRLVAYAIVVQNDTRSLPAVRFLPEGQASTTPSRVMEFANLWESSSAMLDAQRIRLEMGPGGDVTQRGDWQPQGDFTPPADILAAWMILRQQVRQAPRDNAANSSSTEDDADD
jgi:hypothetical protein